MNTTKFVKQIKNFINKHSAFFTLLIIFLLSSIIFPKFLTTLNLNAILKQYSIIGFLALGQLLIILTGGIDLSQGSMIAFTSIVLAILLQNFALPFAIIIAILATLALGFVNGILVSCTKIPPFIVTLGMLGIARGLALLISNEKPISIKSDPLILFGKELFFGIPIIFLVWILFCIILGFVINRRRIGRYIYATGGNEESARLHGINITKVKLIVYSLGSVLTAFGGIVWAARLRSGSPLGGFNYELESIAAVLVGGGSLFGGVGSVTGTMSGVLIFGVINSSLNMAGISPYWQGTLKGIIILIAVAISQLRLRNRRISE